MEQVPDASLTENTVAVNCVWDNLSILQFGWEWKVARRERLLVLPKQYGELYRCHCLPRKPGWLEWWNHSSSLNYGWQWADVDWQRPQKSLG